MKYYCKIFDFLLAFPFILRTFAAVFVKTHLTFCSISPTNCDLKRDLSEQH